MTIYRSLASLDTKQLQASLGLGRTVGIRDLCELVRRLSCIVTTTTNFATKAQRMACLLETYFVFGAHCPNQQARQQFVTRLVAPAWGLMADPAWRYIKSRRPTLDEDEDNGILTVGRIRLSKQIHSIMSSSSYFCPTPFGVCIMESIATCIVEQEPILPVGQTGCGTTTMVQQLAQMMGREFVVQNVSLQTNLTDLLGGYRPVEIQHLAHGVYLEFVNLFASTFSRKQNATFLNDCSETHELKQWKQFLNVFAKLANWV